MQDTLHEKLDALGETLGIVFTGLRVTKKKDRDGWRFTVDGKSLRFSEEFLAAYDIDYVLSMCHLAIGELRARPAKTTVHVGAPMHLS